MENKTTALFFNTIRSMIHQTRVVLALALLLANLSFLNAQRLAQDIPTPDTSEVTILFAGDVMAHMPQINSAFDTSTDSYNFKPVFELVKPYISKADIAVANLETTLAGTPYSGYPQFSCPDSLAAALKDAGFDLLITANNHCLDRGKQGLEQTVKTLDALRIPHTGTFVNDSVRSATYPYIITENGIRIAFLNCTYGTNGFKAEVPNIVNFIDTLQLKQDIRKAKLANVDYTIVTLHWGNEYERDENASQRAIASFLFRNGADLVIGSHPHVVQPARKYYLNSSDSSNFNIVAYSLGNYVSNQRDRYKDGGIMFQVKLRKVRLTKLTEYSYIPTWVYKGYIAGKIEYRITPILDEHVNYNYWGFSEKDKALQFFHDTVDHMENIPLWTK